MIVVKIELWPRGVEARAKEIGRMFVANIGGTHDRGDYSVAVARRGSTEVPRQLVADAMAAQGAEIDSESLAEYPEATRAGQVKNYPRLSYNVWRLISRALRASFPEESPKATRELQARVDRAVQLIEGETGCWEDVNLIEALKILRGDE